MYTFQIITRRKSTQMGDYIASLCGNTFSLSRIIDQPVKRRANRSIASSLIILCANNPKILTSNCANSFSILVKYATEATTYCTSPKEATGRWDGVELS